MEESKNILPEDKEDNNEAKKNIKQLHMFINMMMK